MVLRDNLDLVLFASSFNPPLWGPIATMGRYRDATRSLITPAITTTDRLMERIPQHPSARTEAEASGRRG